MRSPVGDQLIYVTLTRFPTQGRVNEYGHLTSYPDNDMLDPDTTTYGGWCPGLEAP